MEKIKTTWEDLRNGVLPVGYFLSTYGRVTTISKQEEWGPMAGPLVYLDLDKEEVLALHDVDFVVDQKWYSSVTPQYSVSNISRNLYLNTFFTALDLARDLYPENENHLTWTYSHPLNQAIKSVFKNMTDSFFQDTFLLFMKKFLDPANGNKVPLPFPFLYETNGGPTPALFIGALDAAELKDGTFKNVQDFLKTQLEPDNTFMDTALSNVLAFRNGYKMVKQIMGDEEGMKQSIKVYEELKAAFLRKNATKVLTLHWLDGIGKEKSIRLMRKNLNFNTGFTGEKGAGCWLGMGIQKCAFDKLPKSDGEWYDSGLIESGYLVLIPFNKLTKVTDIKDKPLWEAV